MKSVCAMLAVMALLGAASAAAPAKLACPKGTLYVAQLNAKNNLPPSPKTGKSTGTFQGCVTGTTMTWQLNLCDVTGFTASHIHIGNAKKSYPLPLLKIAPATPTTVLPKAIKGCSYTLKGTFTPKDIIPNAANPAKGVPATSTWAQTAALLKSGNLYVNVHTTAAPAGAIRGNLYKSK